MSERHWINGRRIVERIVVRADLVLDSPAHFGTGERGDLTDMDLARDALTGAPLLPGTSIAGALRAALHQREHGYRTAEQRGSATVAKQLFGGSKVDHEGDQSPLIVDDAIASSAATLVRDGVMLNAKTRTAAEKAKYDIELIPAGTTFPLRFELLLSADHNRDMMLSALFTTLSLLGDGAIALGAKKTRGLGSCHMASWRVLRYNLRDAAELVRYLRARDADELAAPTTDLASALGTPTAIPDQRRTVVLSFDAVIDGTMLVRGPLGAGALADAAQLTEGDRVVIPGSSIAGALRARAARILTTIGVNDPLLQAIFGPEQDKVGKDSTAHAARLMVADAAITDSTVHIHNRVAIDRLTGGALDGALFNEQPAVGGTTTLTLTLRCDQDENVVQSPAIGLLLLLLKDLWTGDLPLGGTISIGRGRLAGRSATLAIHAPDTKTTYTLTDTPGFGLDAAQRVELARYVDALQGATR